MNIVLIFLGLLFFAAVAISAILAICAFVALVMGKWVRAAGFIVISVPFAAFACLVDEMMGEDNVVREPVEMSEVAGTYRLEQGAKRYLSRMGYKDSSSEIFLGLQGNFTATRVPACCVNGEDETGRSISEEYYQLKGTWTIKKSSGSAYEVELDLRTAEVSNPPSNNDPLSPSFRTPKFRNLNLLLSKDTSFYLGFPIYTGGDFNYIDYKK